MDNFKLEQSATEIRREIKECRLCEVIAAIDPGEYLLIRSDSEPCDYKEKKFGRDACNNPIRRHLFKTHAV